MLTFQREKTKFKRRLDSHLVLAQFIKSNLGCFLPYNSSISRYTISLEILHQLVIGLSENKYLLLSLALPYS